MKNKIRISILGLLVVCTSSCMAQNCNNKIARDIFKDELQFIESYLNGKDVKLDKLSSSINKVEIITSIESESDGNYWGKFKPTNKDLKNWKFWYDSNKDNLCWNKDKNTLYISKNTNATSNSK